jgi:hypothetical protein
MQRFTRAFPIFAPAALLAMSCLLARAQNSPAASQTPVAPLQQAAAATLNDALLAKATSLYNSTAKMGLHSFDCQVHPDWNKIMTSSRNGIPLPTDDPRLPLLTAVTITLHAYLAGTSTLDWQPSTDKPLDEAATATLDKAHQGIEQTMLGVLKLWIPLADGSVAESLGEDDVDIHQAENGYTVRSKDKQHSLTEEFDSNLILKRFIAADSGSTVDIAPNFQPTNQGLLISGFTAHIRAAGSLPEKSQQMNVAIEYQTISGAQIPSRLSVQVPNVVEMDFALDSCTVNTAPADQVPRVQAPR